jgi:hypothetical protein
MAHFAQLDETNTVTQVIVVHNNVIDNAQGLDGEAEGIAFCQSLYGADTSWKQTSYSKTFRKSFAMVGSIYDPIKDVFIPPKPANGPFILNEENYQWELDTSL